MSGNVETIVKNRKAFHDYEIEERLEAGIVLQGSEVKSLRAHRASLQEAYCAVDRDEEMILHGAHIAPYKHGGEYFNHDPRRNRKLLMHKKEIRKWKKMAEQRGYTIVPLKMYFRGGVAKVEVGLGKGRKLHDKRDRIKERETKRRMEQALREHR